MSKIGTRIEFFHPLFKKNIQATIISAQLYPWCSGASHYSAYSEETGWLHQVSTFRVIDDVERQADFEHALAHYTKRMTQYPIWQERLARDPQYFRRQWVFTVGFHIEEPEF